MSKLRIMAGALALLMVAGAVGVVYRWTAEARAAHAEDRATENAPGKDSDETATIRKTAEEFTRAFARRDAKAVASLWAKNGEYINPEGEAVRGRAAIEKDYIRLFKEYPKATAEVAVESVKLLGKHAAMEEGTLKVSLSGEKYPVVSRYSVLHVREGNAWKMASVREWIPDPASLITLKDIGWLIGEWTAKSNESEAAITYAWDEGKTYIRGRYSLKHKGKVVSSGLQVIGKDPMGGLRSWQFDNNGATGDWFWTRDEDRWMIESAGVLPDGSEVSAVHLLVPISKDAFTWQSAERMAAGAELPGTPPLKVTRVKGKK